MRAYEPWRDIPPTGVGAYGVVAFQGMPTPATRDRLIKICQAYVAYLPKQSAVGSSVALKDQMLTIWPLDNPDATAAINDDCAYVTSHYDLQGGQLAIRDARRQGARLDGVGPYLIGWSPSDARGRPDRVVLVVDLSTFTSQDSFNKAFIYWDKEVVENPRLWRTGFSVEDIRLTVRDFFDNYGQYAINAMGFVNGERQ